MDVWQAKEEAEGVEVVLELFANDPQVATCVIGQGMTLHLVIRPSTWLRTMCGRRSAKLEPGSGVAERVCARCADAYEDAAVTALERRIRWEHERMQRETEAARKALK